MAAKKSQFQSLGGGVYRVTGARVSPTTGRYVTQSARISEGVSRSAKTGHFVSSAGSGQKVQPMPQLPRDK